MCESRATSGGERERERETEREREKERWRRDGRRQQGMAVEEQSLCQKGDRRNHRRQEVVARRKPPHLVGTDRERSYHSNSNRELREEEEVGARQQGTDRGTGEEKWEQ